MSSHTLKRRAMTPAEVNLARQQARSDGGLWFLTVVSCIGVWGAGALGGDLFGPTGRFAGMGLSAGLGLMLGFSFYRHNAKARRRFEADLRTNEVEELTLETERVLALEVDHSSVDPALVLELGGGQLLLLCGQWARKPETYGGGEPAPEIEEELWWNGLKPPHAFPTRRCIITRLAHSGEVLRIEPQGDYLKPEERSVDLAKRAPRPSELLTGSLDAVDAALDTISRASSPAPG